MLFTLTKDRIGPIKSFVVLPNDNLASGSENDYNVNIRLLMANVPNAWWYCLAGSKNELDLSWLNLITRINASTEANWRKWFFRIKNSVENMIRIR